MKLSEDNKIKDDEDGGGGGCWSNIILFVVWQSVHTYNEIKVMGEDIKDNFDQDLPPQARCH